MIDSIPISASPIPVPAIPASEPGQPTSVSMAGSRGVPAPAQEAPPAQTSFASTLQSRLKAMSVGKAAAPAVPAIALEIQDLAERFPIELALPPGLDAIRLEESSAAATPIPAVDDESRTESGENIGSTTAPVIQGADPATQVPLALNAGMPTTPAIPGQNSVPVSAGTATPDKASQENAPAQSNTADKAASSPAILAAQADKHSQGAAKPDGIEKSKSDFAQQLKEALPNPPLPAAQAAGPHASLGSPTSVIRQVPSPVASAHWATDVGNQLVWMANQRESRADLVLNPPQLGRIEVSITLNGDQASASFVSANPDVRDALQGSLPRLREVLADAGVFLGQANIGAESFRQHGEGGSEKGGKSPDDSFSPAGSSLLGLTDGSLSIAAVQPASRGRGLIDLFA